MVLILCYSFITKANDILLVGKIIIIDPGHGGPDSGAVSNNITEKNINLQISKVLKKELEINGATVLMTRENDYDLSEPNALYRKKSDFDNRIKFINESKAYMYISIHQNFYSNSKYYGPQVFYNEKSNKILADNIQQSLNKMSNSDRKIKNIPKTYMYSKLDIPGLLIECGFMSNPEELNKLLTKKYQEKLVKAIVKSIIETV